MSRLKINLLVVLALIATLPVLAQSETIEYGEPTELRGVTKIFVDAGADVRRRDLMARELKKKLPDLTVVSRPEEANVHLRYRGEEVVGTVVRVIDRSRVRVLHSVSDDMPPIFERESIVGYGMEAGRPYRLVWEFVRAYKRANSAGLT